MRVLRAYCDGAFEKKQGAWGFYVLDGGREIYANYGFCDPRRPQSSNVAELQAMYEAIRTILEYECLDMSNTTVIIHGDSKLAINTLAGNYHARKGRYISMYKQAANCLEQLRYRGCLGVHLEWIPRKENHQADRLSRMPYANR